MDENAVADIELRAMRDIARALDSSGDLSAVLQSLAVAIAAGRGNRDVYVYIYDTDTNELVLTGATESPAARQVGTLRVAYGDGVTGWVAASRKSYLVADEPAEDPHFLAYPGIGEERYGAIFSVPIVSRHDDLLGCITVWATNGHSFDPAEVPFVERAAALVAGTFETSRLSASCDERTRVCNGIAELASMTAASTPIIRTIDFATELVRDLGHADVAVSLMTDPSGADRMYIKIGVAPSADSHRDAIVAVRQELLMIDQDVRHGRQHWRGAAEQVAQVLAPIAKAVTTAAMRVGSEELGTMSCYRLTEGRFTVEDSALVNTIACQSAMALKVALLAEELTERSGLNWFLRDLPSGRASAEELRRRARALGLDGASSHVFLVGSIAAQLIPGVDVSATSMGSGLAELLAEVRELPPGTHLATTSHQTIAVIPWSGGSESVDALRAPLVGLCTRLRKSTGTALTFGISRPATTVEEFAVALAEAREAMALGSAMSDPSGVFTVDDVGDQLLISRMSSAGTVRDRYGTAVARIAEYDRVKGTELLDTLAAFLHFRSQTAASRELFIHRNTLNQRLSRCSQLGGFDILDPARWFPLQLALKMHQARTGLGSPPPDLHGHFAC
jgi:sugar diacid utilization regulator/putative methionine-R-sulfoxide reductase with GAF domain